MLENTNRDLIQETWVQQISALNLSQKSEYQEKEIFEDQLDEDFESLQDQMEGGNDLEKWRRILAKAIGVNTEEVYKEVLCGVVHTFGNGKSDKQQDLLQYLQDAFRMAKDKHEMLLEKTRKRGPPKIRLNVEILEAKDLLPNDLNGCEPFCSLYLTSDTERRCFTSVDGWTLSPIWEEQFSLPVTDIRSDTFCIEVWNFDPDEAVIEKFLTETDVGEARFCIEAEDIATSCYLSKQGDEFIGTAEVDLKTIPFDGQTIWMDLKRDNTNTSKGAVKVKMAFNTEKDVQVAAKEHRQLLWTFAIHEIETMQAESVKQWSGQFSEAAERLLHQHAESSRLTEKQVALARWVSYAAISNLHPVSSAAFKSVLQQLKGPISHGLLTEEESDIFLTTSEKVHLPATPNRRRNEEDSQGNEQFDNSLVFKTTEKRSKSKSNSYRRKLACCYFI